MFITSDYKNAAFKSLSFRNKRNTPKEPRTKKYDIYGAILRTPTHPYKYAIVQGRYTGKWSFPKGHAREGETPYTTALRELIEETGVSTLPESSESVPLSFGHYFVFDCPEELALNPRDTNEILAAKWVTLDEMADMKLNADANEYRRKVLTLL